MVNVNIVRRREEKNTGDESPRQVFEMADDGGLDVAAFSGESERGGGFFLDSSTDKIFY